MKKLLLLTFISLFVTTTFGQKNESKVREVLTSSQHIKVVEDWSRVASFESGMAEYVKFIPITITDLKTGSKTKAFRVDMYIRSDYVKDLKIYKKAYISYDEVQDFINFLEKQVIPNLNLEIPKNEVAFYKFNSIELSFVYKIRKKNKRTIIINFNSTDRDNTFWTKTQVKKIPELIKVLKTM